MPTYPSQFQANIGVGPEKLSIPAVSKELGELSEKLEQLDSTIARLEDRFSQALRPPTPQQDNQKPAPQACGCHLAERINAIRQHVHRCNEHLLDLISRSEI